jgi:serine/threonine-protein kinase HipA
MCEIQPRHWHALAKRHGIVSTGADSPFVQVIEQTSSVIQKVQDLIPAGFPVHISKTILNGLSAAAKRYEVSAAS